MSSPVAREHLRATTESLFGRALSPSDFGRMLGSEARDTVVVSPATANAHAISVALSGPSRDARFTVSRNSSGALTAHVDWVGVKADTRSASSGRSIVRALDAMHTAGITRVTAEADRGAETNGYYSWARMGFDGALPSSVRGAAQRQFGAGVTTVQGVMSQRGGAAWWKTNGTTFDAAFDWTNPTSVSAFSRLLQATSRGV